MANRASCRFIVSSTWAEVEQLRDVVFVLIADQLAARLFQLSVGRLFSITVNGMPLT